MLISDDVRWYYGVLGAACDASALYSKQPVDAGALMVAGARSALSVPDALWCACRCDVGGVGACSMGGRLVLWDMCNAAHS